ncbi:hypothetical protein DIPPA_17119 [Diplonema papillatum]|nr:hypothetical protein DIPPA_17119 [Diplonema papillatum]
MTRKGETGGDTWYISPEGRGLGGFICESVDEAVAACLPNVTIDCWFRCDAEWLEVDEEGTGQGCVLWKLWDDVGCSVQALLNQEGMRLVVVDVQTNTNVCVQASFAFRRRCWYNTRWRLADDTNKFAFSVNGQQRDLRNVARVDAYTGNVTLRPRPVLLSIAADGELPINDMLASGIASSQSETVMKRNRTAKELELTSDRARSSFEGVFADFRVSARRRVAVMQGDNSAASHGHLTRLLRQYFTSAAGSLSLLKDSVTGSLGLLPLPVPLKHAREDVVDKVSAGLSPALSPEQREIHAGVERPASCLQFDGHDTSVRLHPSFGRVGEQLGQSTWDFSFASATAESRVLVELIGRGQQRFCVALNVGERGSRHLNRLSVSVTDENGLKYDAVGAAEATTGRWHRLTIALNLPCQERHLTGFNDDELTNTYTPAQSNQRFSAKRAPIALFLDGIRILLVSGHYDGTSRFEFGPFVEPLTLGCPIGGRDILPFAGAFEHFRVSDAVSLRCDIIFSRHAAVVNDLCNGVPVDVVRPQWCRRPRITCLKLDKDSRAFVEIPLRPVSGTGDTPDGSGGDSFFEVSLCIASGNRDAQALVSAVASPARSVFTWLLNKADAVGGSSEPQFGRHSLAFQLSSGTLLTASFHCPWLCDGKWHVVTLRVQSIRRRLLEVLIDDGHVPLTVGTCDGSISDESGPAGSEVVFTCEPKAWSKMFLGARYVRGALGLPFDGKMKNFAVSDGFQRCTWPCDEGVGVTLQPDDMSAPSARAVRCTWENSPGDRVGGGGWALGEGLGNRDGPRGDSVGEKEVFIFDGRKGHVVCRQAPGLWRVFSVGRECSIEFYMKTENATASMTLICARGLSSPGAGPEHELRVCANKDANLCHSPGKLLLSVRDGNQRHLCSEHDAIRVFDGLWHHITWRLLRPFDSATPSVIATLTIDGSPVTDVVTTVQHNPTTREPLFFIKEPAPHAPLCPIVIGCALPVRNMKSKTTPVPIEPFCGSLRSVRIWADEHAILNLSLDPRENSVDCSPFRNPVYMHCLTTAPSVTPLPPSILLITPSSGPVCLGPIGSTGSMLNAFKLSVWLAAASKETQPAGLLRQSVPNDSFLNAVAETTHEVTVLVGGIEDDGSGLAVCLEPETDGLIMVIGDVRGRWLVARSKAQVVGSSWHHLEIDVLSATDGAVTVKFNGSIVSVDIISNQAPSAFSDFRRGLAVGGLLLSDFRCAHVATVHVQELRITCGNTVQGHWPLCGDLRDLSGNGHHGVACDAAWQPAVNCRRSGLSNTETPDFALVGSGADAQVLSFKLVTCSSYERRPFRPADPTFRSSFNDDDSDSPVDPGWLARYSAPQWTQGNLEHPSDVSDVCIILRGTGETEVEVVLMAADGGVLDKATKTVTAHGRLLVTSAYSPAVKAVRSVRIVVTKSSSTPAVFRVKCSGRIRFDLREDLSSAVVQASRLVCSRSLRKTVPSTHVISDRSSELHVRAAYLNQNPDPADFLLEHDLAGAPSLFSQLFPSRRSPCNVIRASRQTRLHEGVANTTSYDEYFIKNMVLLAD